MQNGDLEAGFKQADHILEGLSPSLGQSLQISAD